MIRSNKTTERNSQTLHKLAQIFLNTYEKSQLRGNRNLYTYSFTTPTV